MPFNRRELIMGLAGTALGAACSSAASPEAGPLDLFEAKVGGHNLYRIPGIVVTKGGTVLAYAEARVHTGSDWDDIDILLRRSTDGGRTFSEPVGFPKIPGAERNPVANERKQGKPEWRTYNNPVAIPSRDGGVHFLFCVEYMRIFYCHSKDDGRTWTKPVEITACLEPLRKTFAWRVCATGPGHGIELKNGRIVVPTWIALGTAGNGHGPSVNTTIYSDDKGKTWHCGEIAISDTPEFPSANETMLIENADGSVTMNARTPSPRNRRAISHSPDGARNWSPAKFDDTLVDPICAAGLVRIPRRKGPPLWAFSNPDSQTRADGKEQASKDRRNVTVRISRDEGRTWSKGRVLEPGPSAYSDLAPLNDKTLLCLYEARNASGAAVIRLAHMDIDSLLVTK